MVFWYILWQSFSNIINVVFLCGSGSWPHRDVISATEQAARTRRKVLHKYPLFSLFSFTFIDHSSLHFALQAHPSQFSALCVLHSNLLSPTLLPYTIESPSLRIFIPSSLLHHVFAFLQQIEPLSGCVRRPILWPSTACHHPRYLFRQGTQPFRLGGSCIQPQSRYAGPANSNNISSSFFVC